jgi:FtsP/CotA-like multicopper oxidase with cupredoxin domain
MILKDEIPKMAFQKNIYQKVLPIAALFVVLSTGFGQKTVRYDLFVGDTAVNYTGKIVRALAINGQIPAPTLYFTEGDTALIYVHNMLKEETSIHWHGIIVPNQYDGVPYLTTAPIKPKETHLFKFPIVQNGTYWYHSHTQLQEQRGMYGAFVIRKRREKPQPEYVMLLSDWTNEKPEQVHRSLHNATDWYAIKKGSTQNYGEALVKGYFKTKITNEWKRMFPMDVADVYYERFFINGRQVQEKPEFKPGDQVRLRIANGSSSSYFWLQYAGGKMTVVASDGKDLEPVDVDRMIVAVSETYDVLVTIPADGSFELKATPEDRTQFASLFLGNGPKKTAPVMPRLQYFEGMKMMNGMMRMDGSMDDMGMKMSLQKMDMNMVMYPEMGEELVALNYGMLRSTENTTLRTAPTRTMHFRLTGNMNRYVWTIDNRTVSETDKIMIKHGQNVRIILENASMMRHPMHLHGHFFRVLNGQGAHAPLKNVLDVMPMETDTIEFAATESGDWFFHCHILYHMMSGMGRIFSYENSPPNPELPHPEKALRKLYHDDREYHVMARIGLETNGSDGMLMLANTRWLFQTEWRLGLHAEHGWESESHVGRYVGRNQFLLPYLGWDFRYRRGQIPEKTLFGQTDTKDIRRVFCAGFRYTLPMFVLFDARIDQSGKFRIQLGREDIPLTNRLRFNFMVNSDREYMAGFRYIVSKYLAISTHYDSDMGIGAGVTLSY